MRTISILVLAAVVLGTAASFPTTALADNHDAAPAASPAKKEDPITAERNRIAAENALREEQTKKALSKQLDERQRLHNASVRRSRRR